MLRVWRDLQAQRGNLIFFCTVMDEMGHAELVPVVYLEKPVFYIPMHAAGTSLNDTLLVGPSVHPSLVDILLHCRFHPIALTTDVSQMYRAFELVEDKDLHRFVWR